MDIEHIMGADLGTVDVALLAEHSREEILSETV